MFWKKQIGVFESFVGFTGTQAVEENCYQPLIRFDASKISQVTAPEVTCS